MKIFNFKLTRIITFKDVLVIDWEKGKKKTHIIYSMILGLNEPIRLYINESEFGYSNSFNK